MATAITAAQSHPTLGGANWFAIQGLLDLARSHLGLEVAFISEFAPGHQVIRAAAGDLDSVSIAVGDVGDDDSSFCIRVLNGALPPVIPDARRHLVTRELPATRDLGIGSYIGVPWHDGRGAVAGMLCCLGRYAAPQLGDRDLRFLESLSSLISDHLDTLDGRAQRQASREAEQMADLIQARALDVVFQPIVDLTTDRVYAFEALARFSHPDFPTPAEAFPAAARAGLGPRLERLAIERAFEQLDDVFPGLWVGVNASAEALLERATEELLLNHAHRNIAVELTEHSPVSDYPALRKVIDRLRAAGLRIVIDDAGAGYAGLQHILQIAPEIIKLDISLTRDIDTDEARQALAQSLVFFAQKVDAVIVAEGIETEAELKMLLTLGITSGQGFFLARPAPLP